MKKTKMESLIEEDEYEEVEKIVRSDLSKIKVLRYLDMGRTICHWVAINGSIGLFKLLSSHRDFKVDFPCKQSKTTCLQLACREGKFDLVEFLICKCGASVNLKDKDGYTALHYACLNKMEKIVNFLLKVKGIDFNALDGDNRTPLHRAVEKTSLEIAKILTSLKGIKLDLQDNHGQTALHYASYNQDKDMCVLLGEKGANSKIIDKQGKKALYYGYGFFED